MIYSLHSAVVNLLASFISYMTPGDPASFTTPNSYSRNGDIFTVGAAGVGGAPIVGVLGPSSLAAPTDVTIGAAGNLSRPYS